MLSQWWNALGQLVAPDPNVIETIHPSNAAAAAVAAQTDFTTTLPSSKHNGNTRAATNTTVSSRFDEHEEDEEDVYWVQCVHCHKATPQQPLLPSSSRRMEYEILRASRDTCRMQEQNPTFQQDAANLIKAAVSNRKTTEKTLETIQQVLQLDARRRRQQQDENDNQEDGLSLLWARAYGMGRICPDGYTPLQAAASSNQVGIGRVLLEAAAAEANDYTHTNHHNSTNVKALLRATNLLGQTAQHMAAEAGHEEFLHFLNEIQMTASSCTTSTTSTLFQTPTPQKRQSSFVARPIRDMSGKSPWGTAMTSSTIKARNSRETLHQQLFSPYEFEGQQADAANRIGYILRRPEESTTTTTASAVVVYGTSHCDGKRVVNEDAMLCTTWETTTSTSTSKETIGFWTVCDGHGDKGAVAKLVARGLAKALQDATTSMASTQAAAAEAAAGAAALGSSLEDWQACCETACAQVDAQVKAAKWTGGSTAVFALLTEEFLVVGNIGDSRCILIEKKQENSDSQSTADLVEVMQHLSLEEQAMGAYTVTPLTTDHKPNLPEEKARIERAGLSVVDIKYTDENDQEQVVSKVRLSDLDMLACSRSFGDFEYKKNEKLDPAQQAVVSVPEVCIVRRDQLSEETYLVLACDGVWDVKSNEQVCTFVTETIDRLINEQKKPYILPSVGDALLMECIDSGDNLSVIIAAVGQEAVKKVSSSHAPSPRLERRTLDFLSPLK